MPLKLKPHALAITVSFRHTRSLAITRFGPTCQQAAKRLESGEKGKGTCTEASVAVSPSSCTPPAYPNPRTNTPRPHSNTHATRRNATQRCHCHARTNPALPEAERPRPKASSSSAPLQSPPPRQPPRDTSLPLQAFVSRPDDVAGSSLGAGAGGWTSGGGWVAGWLGGAVAGMPAATATAASLRLPLPKAARHSPRSSRRHPDCRRRR